MPPGDDRLEETIDGCTLRGIDTGGDGPVIAWSHGLLWSHRMYAPQIAALRERYRCIAWDHRGQGDSDVPDGRSVSIERVTTDAIVLLERLVDAPVHFVGLSMGGFVGMRIAARRPDLVRSLALVETAPDPEPEANRRKYRMLNLAARTMGVGRLLSSRVMPVMFSETFLSDPARADDREARRQELMSLGRSIHKAVTGVIEREGVTHELKRIRCPTTVIRGTEDAAIARERARLLVDHIEGARWVEIPRAGHTSTLEEPEALTRALREHLEAAGPG